MSQDGRWRWDLATRTEKSWGIKVPGICDRVREVGFDGLGGSVGSSVARPCLIARCHVSGRWTKWFCGSSRSFRQSGRSFEREEPRYF